MIKKFLRALIYFFNLMFPKCPKLIFMLSSTPFKDNLEAILDCMLNNKANEEYRIVCYSENGNKYDSYRGVRHLAIIHSKISALIVFLFSKYVFINNGIFSNVKPVSKQIIVNVWHGVSFKKIGFYIDREKPYRRATKIVTYSELFAEKMSYAFCVPNTDILLTGEPRNDYLFCPVTNDSLQQLGIPNSKDSKIVIWMPTYRQSKKDNTIDGRAYDLGIPFISIKNMSELDKWCRIKRVVLIIKWHSLQKIPKEIKHYNNIVFLTSEDVMNSGIPLYRIIANTSALITDYSSVFVNYLVLNRPICFAYDDLEEYKDKRGFMFENVEDYMPGYKADSIEDIMTFISDVSEEKDEYVNERYRINKILNKYSDSDNSKRLLKTLGIV